jgi:hypothetical protein
LFSRWACPDRFGYEWHNYSELRPEYEDQFRHWTAHLGPDDWRGLKFLDVGCGMRRNPYWHMTYVHSVVLRSMWMSARSLWRDFQPCEWSAAARTSLAQRMNSIWCIDWRDPSSLQYPERAVAQMVAAAKPGGRGCHAWRRSPCAGPVEALCRDRPYPQARGTFLYREPVSDFIPWRGLRAVIYRLSPMLDNNTERPLIYRETVPVLEQAGLQSVSYRTHG